tara:strand:+ start:326 stop:697 length:372 start_codon:yes stop_codon:yes gene_type:complete
MGNQPQKIDKAVDCFRASQMLIRQFKDHMCNYLRTTGCGMCTLTACSIECKKRLNEVKRVVERDFATALEWFENNSNGKQYPDDIQEILNRYSVLSVFLPHCKDKLELGNPTQLTIEPCNFKF